MTTTTTMRRIMLLGTCGISLAALALTPSVATGQVNLDSLRAAHDCANAVRIVRLGKPDKKEDWAWGTLPRCGAEAATAIAEAWLAQRAVADTVPLSAVYDRVWRFRDAGLFNTAMTLAGDPGATSEARVFSVMVLLDHLLDGQSAQYRYLSDTPALGVCRLSYVADRNVQTLAPLAADSRQRAKTLAQALAAGGTTPQVQSAGRCLAQALAIDDKVQASKPIQIPPP